MSDKKFPLNQQLVSPHETLFLNISTYLLVVEDEPDLRPQRSPHIEIGEEVQIGTDRPAGARR